MNSCRKCKFMHVPIQNLPCRTCVSSSDLEGFLPKHTNNEKQALWMKSIAPIDPEFQTSPGQGTTVYLTDSRTGVIRRRQQITSGQLKRIKKILDEDKRGWDTNGN